MHFELKGKETSPVIILFGVPFCSMEPYRALAELLEQDCRVLLVTWDGHEQHEITYTSARDQAAKTITWLSNSGIRDIALLCGFGSSGKAAMQMAKMLSEAPDWHLGRVLFDSCALQKLLWPRRMLRIAAVRCLQKSAAKGTPEEALARLQKNLLVRFLTEDTAPYELFLKDFVRVSRNISAKSTHKLIHDACSCTLHEFPQRMNRRLVFMWSGKGVSSLARHRLLNAYPKATEHMREEPGMLGFMVRQPAAYAQILSGLAQLPVKG